MIIENAGKCAAWKRGRDAVLSAVMWLLYIYWIRAALFDIAALAADGYAWMFEGAAIPQMGSISAFGATVLPYLAAVAVNATALILWAQYNQLRFRGRDRHRDGQHQVGAAELGVLYAVPVGEVERWQASRRMTIRHAADGSIIEVAAVDTDGSERLWAPEVRL